MSEKRVRLIRTDAPNILTVRNPELSSSVRLETDCACGSGFFFLYNFDESSVETLLIITNKHVIAGSSSVVLRLHMTSDTDLDVFPPPWRVVEVQDVQSLVIHHPKAEVDICAIDVGPIFSMLNERGLKPVVTHFHENQILTPENLRLLRGAEIVTMSGYPNGLFDRKNNYPILRRGICATHPAIDFEGEPHFLVDMAVYPGSSGSAISLKMHDLIEDLCAMQGGSEARPEIESILPKTALLGIAAQAYWGTFDHPIGMDVKVRVPDFIRIDPSMKTLEIANELQDRANWQWLNLGLAIRANELMTMKQAVISQLEKLYQDSEITEQPTEATSM